jgi:hypothetical protein
MKYLLLVALALMLSIAPAQAFNGQPPYYMLVYGLGYPQEIVAGPFDGANSYEAYNNCSWAQRQYAQSDPGNGYKYHCDIKY